MLQNHRPKYLDGKVHHHQMNMGAVVFLMNNCIVGIKFNRLTRIIVLATNSKGVSFPVPKVSINAQDPNNHQHKFVASCSQSHVPAALVLADCPISSSPICCCNTMLYTLAFSSVKTKLVFLSNPLSASNISAEGFAARSETSELNLRGCISTAFELLKEEYQRCSNFLAILCIRRGLLALAERVYLHRYLWKTRA